MVEFINKDDKVYLRYTPEFPKQEDWVNNILRTRGFVTIKKTFKFITNHTKEFKKNDLTDDYYGEEYEPVYFLFAVLKGEYYKILDGVLVETFEIFIHQDIIFNPSYFVADSELSVFRLIRDISNNDIWIGGNHPASISLADFDEIINRFPTAYEKKKYAQARVSSVLKNYFEDVKDSEKIFQAYLNRKLSSKEPILQKTFQEIDLIKYENIHIRLSLMLLKENEMSEKQWQAEILQIILLLYPKYLLAFKEVPVTIKVAENAKQKYLDFLLVDSNGNVDILEIKKPFENSIMTTGFYRDNYIPLRDLSGTVMQIEKYIYYLNRWSYDGEAYLNKKYEKQLPQNFKIKITNPAGIIIMGRENRLSLGQKRDFEVVKRKYKNIVDIITYDNMLERLKLTIEQIKKL